MVELSADCGGARERQHHPSHQLRMVRSQVDGDHPPIRQAVDQIGVTGQLFADELGVVVSHVGDAVTGRHVTSPGDVPEPESCSQIGTPGAGQELAEPTALDRRTRAALQVQQVLGAGADHRVLHAIRRGAQVRFAKGLTGRSAAPHQHHARSHCGADEEGARNPPARHCPHGGSLTTACHPGLRPCCRDPAGRQSVADRRGRTAAVDLVNPPRATRRGRMSR